MYYFNALFNFAIYYGFLIILAIIAALWIEQVVSRSQLVVSPLPIARWRHRLVAAGPTLISCFAILVLLQESRRFRSIPFDQDQQRMFATSMERALADNPNRPKLLTFDARGWGEAVSVALYLERAHCPWKVLSYSSMIPLIFGRTKAITDVQTEALPNSSTWQILLKEDALRLKNNNDFVVLPLSKDINLAFPSTSKAGEG